MELIGSDGCMYYLAIKNSSNNETVVVQHPNRQKQKFLLQSLQAGTHTPILQTLSKVTWLCKHQNQVCLIHRPFPFALCFCAKKIWNKVTKATAADSGYLLRQGAVELCWQIALAVPAGTWGRVGHTFRSWKLKMSSMLPRALGAWSWCLLRHLPLWLRSLVLSSWGSVSQGHITMSSIRKGGREQPYCPSINRPH